MSSKLNYCCTCGCCILVLFLLTYLGKKQLERTEPFILPMDVNTSDDVLLDETPSLKINHVSYQHSQKKRIVTPMSSFEQVSNNQKYTSPDNGSILLPELSGFYK
jgi:hypothetical protein